MNVEFRGIVKRFDRLQALTDVSFTIESGTVHALVGENGAGKSTLMRILAGAERADAGEISLDGRLVNHRSPRDALMDGITIIAQELALEPDRTVIENVFLGIESRRLGLLDKREMRRRFKELVTKARFSVPPDLLVRRLRTADQQRVEILRALARDARLIIMDEPTAALTSDEADRLLNLVLELREDGKTIVYVSHSLKEVLAVADTVTVLRDGRHVRTGAAAEESPQLLVSAMLGFAKELGFPDRKTRPSEGATILSVRHLSRPPLFTDVSFDVRAGEIVGMAGLVGSGRSEVARAILGVDPPRAGSVEMSGRRMGRHTPRDSIQAGLAMLPESRKQGLLLRRSIKENVALSHLNQLSRYGVIRTGEERRRTTEIVRRLDVKAPDVNVRISTLSGGNQQKTMFAKCLVERPAVLVIDEPTRGVDVGAKHAIYQIIDSLARDGMGVLLISSEIEEILGLSDRVLVMRNGRLVAEFAGEDANENAVLAAAFGTHQSEIA